MRRLRLVGGPGSPVALARHGVGARAPRRGGLAAASGEPLAPPAGREARDALSAFLEHHLGRRLQARRFLEEVGPMLGE